MSFTKNEIILCLLMIFMASGISKAQAQAVIVEADSLDRPYDPAANAQADIDGILAAAKLENKNIILQAGGNWCIWCLRFNNFIHENAAVYGFLDKNFIYYHLNYSKENKNEAVFQKYAPEGSKLGYPFFIVLNPDGKVLTLQESGGFELDKSYDQEKVLSFLKSWVSEKK